MAVLASDWLRHFQLLLWNCWTAFNETWQEERSQRPLPSLCFLGWSEKQDGCPGVSVKKVAHCTQVHDMWSFGSFVSKSCSHLTNITDPWDRAGTYIFVLVAPLDVSVLQTHLLLKIKTIHGPDFFYQRIWLRLKLSNRHTDMAGDKIHVLLKLAFLRPQNLRLQTRKMRVKIQFCELKILALEKSCELNMFQ